VPHDQRRAPGELAARRPAKWEAERRAGRLGGALWLLGLRLAPGRHRWVPHMLTPGLERLDLRSDRDRVVSKALRAYAAMAISADSGAVRHVR
jgi:hypothetical protein